MPKRQSASWGFFEREKERTLEHPRRYDPAGRPVTTRVKASVQRSHSQVWSPRSAKNQTMLAWTDLEIDRQRRKNNVIRFVVRDGVAVRV